MTERVRPYWVNNVARIDFSPKGFSTGPCPLTQYGSGPLPLPSAQVIRFTLRPRK